MDNGKEGTSMRTKLGFVPTFLFPVLGFLSNPPFKVSSTRIRTFLKPHHFLPRFVRVETTSFPGFSSTRPEGGRERERERERESLDG